MGIFDQKNNGKFAFVPNEGKDATYTITGELKRVTCDDTNVKYSYKKLVNGVSTPYGYFDVIEVDGEKDLLVNAWKFYFALQKLNPEIGDVIVVSHPKRGEYVVNKA